MSWFFLDKMYIGPEGVLNRKKTPIFFVDAKFHKLQEDSKNLSLKIGSKGPQKLGPFSHFSFTPN